VVRRWEGDLADRLTPVQPVDLELRPAGGGLSTDTSDALTWRAPDCRAAAAKPCSGERSALPVSASAAVRLEDA
jgi:hypothetical protein